MSIIAQDKVDHSSALKSELAIVMETKVNDNPNLYLVKKGDDLLEVTGVEGYSKEMSVYITDVTGQGDY
jgi:hypothetical protein